MSISRSIAVLTVVAVTLVLAGQMAGKTAPVAEKHRKMKTSFAALQKKLPSLVAHWLGESGWIEPKQVKTEIKLARFTGPSDAKITLFISLTNNESGILHCPERLSFHLHYFDGMWTTTRFDCGSKWTEMVVDLMLTIDRAAQIDRDTKSGWRVGQVFIVGNVTVPDTIVLEQCPLFPGQTGTLADLRQAEKNLARLGLFVTDRKRGMKPTVKRLDRENSSLGFQDIMIEVKEKPNVKQLLAIRESIQFVLDWKTWGVLAAIYRVEGFPHKIFDLLSHGEMKDVLGLIRGRFLTEEEGCTGYTPPAAVAP